MRDLVVCSFHRFPSWRDDTGHVVWPSFYRYVRIAVVRIPIISPMRNKSNKLHVRCTDDNIGRVSERSAAERYRLSRVIVAILLADGLKFRTAGYWNERVQNCAVRKKPLKLPRRIRYFKLRSAKRAEIKVKNKDKLARLNQQIKIRLGERGGISIFKYTFCLSLDISCNLFYCILFIMHLIIFIKCLVIYAKIFCNFCINLQKR